MLDLVELTNTLQSKRLILRYAKSYDEDTVLDAAQYLAFASPDENERRACAAMVKMADRMKREPRRKLIIDTIILFGFIGAVFATYSYFTG